MCLERSGWIGRMKHSKFYISVTIFLLLYVIVTRAVFIAALFWHDLPLAILVPTTIAGISGFAYLYFFLHEDRFKFIRIIKNKKIKAEKKLIHRFIRFGSMLTALTIGFVAGPLFAALTIAILLSDYKYRYWYVIIISTLSVSVSFCIARGIIHIIL